ncbi:NUDIX domain-containing protein [Candidatus Woesearchaeota archaeon]|nr:NUDIX domain-containing protein [Candidatus Woesearchaeota archaeon]
MSDKRRKGVAIVDTDKGILVVAGRGKRFILPGGGAEKWESRKKATIRELYEETGLKTKNIVYLFRYVGSKWHAHGGKSIRNYAKVFLVESEGNPKPRHEIKYIAFWKTGSNLNLTGGTKKVIEKYLRDYKQ